MSVSPVKRLFFKSEPPTGADNTTDFNSNSRDKKAGKKKCLAKNMAQGGMEERLPRPWRAGIEGRGLSWNRENECRTCSTVASQGAMGMVEESQIERERVQADLFRRNEQGVWGRSRDYASG